MQAPELNWNCVRVYAELSRRATHNDRYDPMLGQDPVKPLRLFHGKQEVSRTFLPLATSGVPVSAPMHVATTDRNSPQEQKTAPGLFPSLSGQVLHFPVPLFPCFSHPDPRLFISYCVLICKIICLFPSFVSYKLFTNPSKISENTAL